MGRISYTFKIMGASWEVLKKDKELLLFPVFSGIACMLVLAAFLLPLILGGLAEQFFGFLGALGSMAVAFGYYVVNYAVIFFFNTAVIGCAIKRLRGGDPTVSDGFDIAFKRLPQILGWSVVAATVGMILHALEQQKILGRIVAAILGAAFSLISFIAVPILVVEGKGPIDAIKEATQMLKQSWGTQMAANFSFGIVFFLISLPLFGLIWLGAQSGQAMVFFICLGAGAIGLLALAVVQSALYAIFQAAMYLTLRNEPFEGFDRDQLAVAAMMR